MLIGIKEILGPETRPVPGGIGYGVTYLDGALSFSTGSTLWYKIIVPPVVGGNCSDFLYLTATNRTTLGTEALASYQEQSTVSFCIYDWSIAGDRWAIVWDESYLDGRHYFQTVQHNGRSYRILNIANATRKVEDGVWANEVFFFTTSGVLERAYGVSYNVTSDDAQHGGGGWWGPIVETFQNDYQSLNPLGFLDCRLQQDNNAKVQLLPANCKLQGASHGLQVIDHNDYYSFVLS
jgi:hypothetical protein